MYCEVFLGGGGGATNASLQICHIISFLRYKTVKILANSTHNFLPVREALNIDIKTAEN
jgi:hypothetical protein